MLQVDFINVGYGDAILIHDFEADFNMLIDTGDITTGTPYEGSKRISAADFMKERNLHSLDLLVLTHLHRDHSGGLTDLLDDVTVKEFWTNYLPAANYWGTSHAISAGSDQGATHLQDSMNIYLAALQRLAGQGTAIEQITAPHRECQLTDKLHAAVYLEKEELFKRQAAIWQDVLDDHPDIQALDELDRFINNTSIRMRLSYGGKSIELPGDVYAACWQKHSPAACDIVKLPHHGHFDSLTPQLLAMLQPKDVVISVSNDRTDDCPARQTMSIVTNYGSKLFITDAVSTSDDTPSYHNAITFNIDG